jgi:hypothetical protein
LFIVWVYIFERRKLWKFINWNILSLSSKLVDSAGQRIAVMWPSPLFEIVEQRGDEFIEQTEVAPDDW